MQHVILAQDHIIHFPLWVTLTCAGFIVAFLVSLASLLRDHHDE